LQQATGLQVSAAYHWHKAMALTKLRLLLRLQLPDDDIVRETAGSETRPIIHIYSRQSGLDVRRAVECP
jgi:hypothetical protein